MQDTTREPSSDPQHWKSRFTFLMASIGFAVGLGNIWKFPYVTGIHGGGSFVIVYLICAFGICVPILMAEIMVGRRGRKVPNITMACVAEQEGGSTRWGWLGAMTMLTAFSIMVIYCVISGWVLQYLWTALSNGFAGLTQEDAVNLFAQLLDNPVEMFFWTALSLGLTALVVGAGLHKGIERTVIVLMPLLFILLILMVGYGAYAGSFQAALEFLFRPDFSKLRASSVLVAIGQAFFSIGVAMGAMMMYGAYLPKDVSIGRSAVTIVLADTLVALLAGLAIFPIVFAYGMDPQGGTGLIFQALPVAFANMPAGYLYAIAFFALLSVAAITSMVGLLETLVSWMVERGVSRRSGAWGSCAVILALSVLSILSYVEPAAWPHGALMQRFISWNFTDIVSFLTDQVTLPLGGLLIAIFAGWVMSAESTSGELNLGSALLYRMWAISIRYLAPVALALMLAFGYLGS